VVQDVAASCRHSQLVRPSVGNLPRSVTAADSVWWSDRISYFKSGYGAFATSPDVRCTAAFRLMRAYASARASA